MSKSLSLLLVPTLLGTGAFLAPQAYGHPYEADTLHLESSAKEQRIGEAQAVGKRQAVSANTVNTQLDAAAISQSIGQSMTNLMERVGGVSAIRTGANAAKPVIQGMHSTRILILNNGARQTGQQWGLDHAPEIDQHTAHALHVVKGAEAVRYGSEAIGGIVLMEQKPLPYSAQRIGGYLSSLYAPNGHRRGGVGALEGPLGKQQNWAWRIQTTYQNAGDRSTPNYLLNNTGSREQHFSAALGYRKNQWRAEVFFSRFDHKYGVLTSAQMGNENLLKERIALGRPVEIQPFSRTIGYPHQHVVHSNATLRLHHVSNSLGTWSWQTTFQRDDRSEHRFRRLNRSNIPAVSLHLNSWQHYLRWQKNFSPNWKTEAGAQWLSINHHNEAGTGVVPIIPNYTENSLGFFAIQKYNRNGWSAEGGLRFDYQQTQADGFNWMGRRYGGQRRFNNFTYSLGGRRNLTRELSLISHLGAAWRAPHVQELYSNGNELGSGIFQRGDENLRSERGYKWSNSLRYETAKLQIQLDGYLHWMDGFIYDRPLHQNITVVSGAYPLFQFTQSKAFFRGFDFEMRYSPLPHWEYRIDFSAVWANERKTGQYLPYIPAPRLQQALIYRSGKYWLSVNHRFTAKQTRFDASTDLIDQSPPAYHLWGAEAGVDIAIRKSNLLRIYLAGENLTNCEYKEYTNRARYYSHDLGRDVRLSVGWHF